MNIRLQRYKKIAKYKRFEYKKCYNRGLGQNAQCQIFDAYHQRTKVVMRLNFSYVSLALVTSSADTGVGCSRLYLKRSTSFPFNTGVSLIGLAINKYVFNIEYSGSKVQNNIYFFLEKHFYTPFLTQFNNLFSIYLLQSVKHLPVGIKNLVLCLLELLFHFNQR